MKRPRIALVTHDLSFLGGIQKWMEFLYRAFEHSDQFDVEAVSIAMSSRDAASRRIVAPSTWWQPNGVVGRRVFEDVDFRHVGANLVELEFQRYRPRPELTKVLSEYDLIQFVVGFASWGYVASQVDRPIVMLVGTTTGSDRRSRVRAAPPPVAAWLAGMGWIAERYERRALALADRVIVPSDYTLLAVQPWTRPGRAEIGFCGVDTDGLRPRQGVERSGILTVGRFDDPRKNLGLTLRAYSQLPADTRPTLRVVGATPGHLRALATELGVEKHVTFMGILDDSELRELYASSALYVLSSDEEGLSMVIQEAMASGLPVISTDCGGPSTVVREGVTGRLTPVGDDQALARTLCSMLAHPEEMRRMGAAGRAFAEEHFSIPRAAATFASAWEKALAGTS